MNMPTQWRSIIAISCLTLVVRGLVIGLGLAGIGPFGGLDTDPDSYRLIAETLAQSGTFGLPTAADGVDPTAFRPPLYPWLLSWLVSDGQLQLLLVAVFHVLLGTSTAIAAFLIASRLFESSKLGFIAGVLVAFDPLLLLQSTLVMTETLATALAAWSWLLLSQTPARTRTSFTASILLSLAFLCRPTFIVWTVLIVAFRSAKVLFDATFAERKATITFFNAIVILSIPAIVVSLWTIRNWRMLGEPVWATTHGGYTMLLGNNPSIYDYLENENIVSLVYFGNTWDATPFHDQWDARLRLSRQLNLATNQQTSTAVDAELAEDRLAGIWAKETIRERPKMFAFASLMRVVWLWSPFPNISNPTVRVLLSVYFGMIYAACLISLIRHRSTIFTSSGMAAIALVVSLTLVHAIYWSNIRMRSPAVPILAVLASGASLRRIPTRDVSGTKSGLKIITSNPTV